MRMKSPEGGFRMHDEGETERGSLCSGLEGPCVGLSLWKAKILSVLKGVLLDPMKAFGLRRVSF